MAQITGTAATDILIGTADQDTITGLAGDDFLSGEGENDRLVGDGGYDTLNGGAGDDTLVGGSADDDFNGGSGNDTFDGSPGSDDVPDTGFDVEGGFIFDFDEIRYDIEGGGGAVTVDLRDGTATDTFGDMDTVIDVERVRGTDQADQILGGNPDNDLFESFRGLGGADFINGRSGHDRVEHQQDGGFQGIVLDFAAETVRDGTGSIDTIRNIEGVRATNFSDELNGSDADFERYEPLGGNDFIDGKGGTDRVDYQNSHFFPAYTGAPTPAIDADLKLGRIADINNLYVDTVLNIEDVTGTVNGDAIRGDGGKNRLDGFFGDDLVAGRGGKDELIGNLGNDILLGGGGNDTINGGAGDDAARGGAGKDVFVLEDGFDFLTVRDFTNGDDKLDFSDFNFSKKRDVLNRADQKGSKVVIELNNDGGVVVLKDFDIGDLNGSDLLI